MRPDSLAAVVFAIFIKEHIPSSAGWRRFAVINGVGLPRFGFVNDHEAAAAEISGPRKRYRQSEPDRNGRVDRIATLFEEPLHQCALQPLLAEPCRF